jgi:hypothetical protein
MKMGTTRSLCPYDAAARRAAPIGKSAMARDFALRLIGGCVPDFAGWSGYPSIAVLSLNPGINVMCQTLHFALQEKQQPFSRDDASLSLSCQPSWVA